MGEKVEESRAKKVGKWTIGKLLGEGQYGKVKLGISSENGERVALKFLQKSQITTEKKREYIQREIQIQKTLKNPYIVPLIEVIETKKAFILVLEYCEGGDLMEYLMGKGPMKEERIADIFGQILRGVAYLHSQMIIHRDLKPDNILFDKEYKNIKIHDFGQSRIIVKGELLRSSVGTPQYCAPEVLLSNKSKCGYVGPAVDIWSLGVILYTMCFGHFPWVGDTLQEQIDNASKGSWFKPIKLDLTLEHLLNRMLNVKPQERATLAEVVMHPFLQRQLRIDVTDWPAFLPLNPLSTVDKDTLEKMVSLGFEEDKIRNIILRSGVTTSQVYILYYSLLGKKFDQTTCLRARSFSAVDMTSAPDMKKGLLKKLSKAFLIKSKK